MAFIFSALFVTWNCIAGISDWRERRVSNTWLVTGLILGLAATFSGSEALVLTPRITLADSIWGCLAGLAIMLPGFVTRHVGASDVKFLAVTGLWVGTHAVLLVWVIASLLALLHAAVYFATKRRQVAVSSTTELPRRTMSANRGIPYVSYFALAVFVISASHLLDPQDFSASLA